MIFLGGGGVRCAGKERVSIPPSLFCNSSAWLIFLQASKSILSPSIPKSWIFLIMSYYHDISLECTLTSVGGRFLLFLSQDSHSAGIFVSNPAHALASKPVLTFVSKAEYQRLGTRLPRLKMRQNSLIQVKQKRKIEKFKSSKNCTRHKKTFCRTQV